MLRHIRFSTPPCCCARAYARVTTDHRPSTPSNTAQIIFHTVNTLTIVGGAAAPRSCCASCCRTFIDERCRGRKGAPRRYVFPFALLPLRLFTARAPRCRCRFLLMRARAPEQRHAHAMPSHMTKLTIDQLIHWKTLARMRGDERGAARAAQSRARTLMRARCFCAASAGARRRIVFRAAYSRGFCSSFFFF